MMSIDTYLGDATPDFLPHVMFFLSEVDPATWGADSANSPIHAVPQFRDAPEPVTTFIVLVGNWSDGTAIAAQGYGSHKR